MFACLYDKNFIALGSWATYACSTWSLTRKAYEFDELSITTRAIDNSAQGVYIGLHESDGALKYMAFCGKPTTHEGNTTIKAVDLRQIFKQKVVIDLISVATSGSNKLQQLYQYLLGLPLTLTSLGMTYTIDVSDVDQNPRIWNEDAILRTAEVGNLWDVIQAVNMIYDCYVLMEVNLAASTIVCKVKVIYKLISFKLSDFGKAKVINDTTVTNRVIAINTTNSTKSYWYLLNDDTVLDEPTANIDWPELIIYPPRYETVEADNTADAVARALEILYANRFQCKVEIDSDSPMGYLLKQIDLSTFADVYGYNAADESTKKRLPVMHISEGSEGKIGVAFGRLTEYWY